MSMNVFYCPKCPNLLVHEGNVESIKCEKCGGNAVNTGCDVDKWKSIDDEERKKVLNIVTESEQKVVSEQRVEKKESKKQSPKPVKNSGEGYANALGIVGGLFIAFGLLGGFIAFAEFGFVSGVIVLASGLVSGVLFLGFSEIIQQLINLNNKFDKLLIDREDA